MNNANVSHIELLTTYNVLHYRFNYLLFMLLKFYEICLYRIRSLSWPVVSYNY